MSVLRTMECKNERLHVYEVGNTMSNAWNMEGEGEGNGLRRQQAMHDLDEPMMKTKMRNIMTPHCKQTLNRLKQMWEWGKQISKQQELIHDDQEWKGKGQWTRCFVTTVNDNGEGFRVRRRPTMAYLVAMEKKDCGFLQV